MGFVAEIVLAVLLTVTARLAGYTFRNLAFLDLSVLVTTVALFGRFHKACINDLTTTGDQSLLAQLSTTSFLNLATALDANRAEAIDGASERLANLTTSHANLGCDSATLRRTLDCVLDAAGDGRSRDVAQTCLAREGVLGE